MSFAGIMPGAVEPAPQWALDRIRQLTRQVTIEQRQAQALRKQLAAVTSTPAEQLREMRADRDRLESVVDKMRGELAAWHERESTDAAAGSYALRAEQAEAERDELAQKLAAATRTVAAVAAPKAADAYIDLIRYLPANDDAGRLALWCTDCVQDPSREPPFWTEDDASEQVTELCLANLVAIAEQHEQQHHDDDESAA